jgi:hypothetical protein
VPSEYKRTKLDDDNSKSIDRCEKALDAVGKDTDSSGPKEQEVEFESDAGTLISETVDSFRSASALSADMHELARVMDGCPHFRMTLEDGSRVPVTLRRLRIPRLGDESLTYRVTMTIQGFDAGIDLVFVRVDRSVLFLGTGGLGIPDKDLTISLARKATNRLIAVAR